MGNWIGRTLFRQKEVRILMVGLDAAGKTTLLYKMKLGEVVTSIPTIGFNVETIQTKRMNLVSWDVGGRCPMRPLYRHYYQNADALVVTIDCNDRDRFSEALDETIGRTQKEEELLDVPYLILANKQDLPCAMTPEDVYREIRNRDYLRNRKWAVFGTSATNANDNLYTAFDWLSAELEAREKNKYVNGSGKSDDGNGKADVGGGGAPTEKMASKWSPFNDIVLALKQKLKYA